MRGQTGNRIRRGQLLKNHVKHCLMPFFYKDSVVFGKFIDLCNHCLVNFKTFPKYSKKKHL